MFQEIADHPHTTQLTVFYSSFVPKPKTIFFLIDIVLRFPLRPYNCKFVVVVIVVAVAAYDDDAFVHNRIVQIMNIFVKILGNLISSVLKKHFNIITVEN